MTEQKKERISKIMKQLSNLPADKREELGKKLGIVNPEGHRLSIRNQCLIYFQNIEQSEISVVAGYKQWQKFQRQVKKGSSGFVIAVPSVKPNNEEDEEDEIYFLYKTVFDISQTEEIPNIN